jgi:hypothetical protein
MQTHPEMAVISTPDFVRFGEQAGDWLNGLDDEPQRLGHYLAPLTGPQVGLHFERLVRFWLEECSDYEILAHNLQVIENGRTLGAFDFIVRAPNGRAEHWELAVKFYLQARASGDWDAWVGPNGRDRLDIKLGRMAGHQLPLSQTAPGREALSKLGVTEVIRRAFIKGIFFGPWKGERAVPQGAESLQPAGRWLFQSELLEYAGEHRNDLWVEHHKPRWLAPADGRQGGAGKLTVTAGELAGEALHRPRMFTQFAPGDPVQGNISTRVFVVPDSWPNADAARAQRP